MFEKTSPFNRRQKINDSHIFDQTSKSNAPKIQGEDTNILQSDHYLYSRVVLIQIKGKRLKDNAILPYQTFCNGFLSFKGQLYYVFTCLHPFIHFQNNPEEKVEITSIHFKSFGYAGELYCSDQSSESYGLYKQQINSYVSAKKRQIQAFQGRNKELKDYSRDVADVVANDWVILVVKSEGFKKENSECEKYRNLIKSQQTNFLVAGGYEQDLQMVAWEENVNVKYYNNSRQYLKSKSLMIKTHNNSSKNRFSYFTEPNAFMHGLISKYGDSGAPIYQNIQEKLRWVGMNCGIFCQIGIGVHFNRKFRERFNQLLQKIIKEKGSIQKQRQRIQYMPFLKEQLLFKQGAEHQSYIIQVIAQSFSKQKEQQIEFCKYSSGIILNQKYVLTFLHNIYQKTESDFSKLTTKVRGRKYQHQLEIILPDLKQKIKEYNYNKNRYLSLLHKNNDRQSISQAFLDLVNSDILMLQIKQPLKIQKNQNIQKFSNSHDLFLQAYSHILNKQQREFTVSRFNVLMQGEKVSLTNQNQCIYQFHGRQDSICSFKTGGAIVLKLPETSPKIVGMHYGTINKKSYAIVFDEDFMKKIEAKIGVISHKKKMEPIKLSQNSSIKYFPQLDPNQQWELTKKSQNCQINYLKIGSIQCFHKKSTITKVGESHFQVGLHELKSILCSGQPIRGFPKRFNLYIKISSGQISSLEYFGLSICSKQSADNTKEQFFALEKVDTKIKILITSDRKDAHQINLKGSRGNQIELQVEFVGKRKDAYTQIWSMSVFWQKQISPQTTKKETFTKKLPQVFLDGKDNYVFFSLRVSKPIEVSLQLKKN